MTITFPRELPDAWQSWSPKRARFDLPLFGDSSRTARGEVTFIEQAGSLWTASYTTQSMIHSDRRRWTAWRNSLRGNGLFRGHDPRRLYPAAHGPAVLAMTKAVGGAPFTGACRVTAAGGTAIALDGLPAGLTLSEDDLVSFAWLGSRWLVSVLEARVSNAGGVISDMPVSPWVRAGGTAPAEATIVRPYALMKIVPGSWSDESDAHLVPIAFDAIQDLRSL